MERGRKQARDKLKEATRKEFESMIFEGMLTEIQEKILRLHIAHQKSISQIACHLAYSESYVRKQLTKAYNRIAKI